ncbi:MAG: type II toxin-antitoxin system RelE/ParE family toxin [Desulfobacterales bacterium]
MGRMRGYRLLYSKTTRRLIAALHPEIKAIVRSRLDGLKKEPFTGKRLVRELAGYRSLRAGRYRIIYKVNEAKKAIEVHYVGHRRDIYEILAERPDSP